MTELTPVRVASAGDEDAILRLCRLLHEENGLFRMNEERVRALLQRAFARDGAIVGVIDQDGGIRGCVLLYVETMWYSDEKFLQEIFNFVDPEHRKTNYAKSLIAFAKHSADFMDMPLLIGIISNKRTAAKVRLYSQQLEQAGAFFIHNGHFAKQGVGSIALG